MSASGSGPSAAIPAIPAAGPRLVKREDLGDDDERVCKAPVPGSNNQAPEAGEWHKLGKLPQDGGSPALEYGKLCADLSKEPRSVGATASAQGAARQGCQGQEAEGGVKKRGGGAWPYGKWGG